MTTPRKTGHLEGNWTTAHRTGLWAWFREGSTHGQRALHVHGTTFRSCGLSELDFNSQVKILLYFSIRTQVHIKNKLSKLTNKGGTQTLHFHRCIHTSMCTGWPKISLPTGVLRVLGENFVTFYYLLLRLTDFWANLYIHMYTRAQTHTNITRTYTHVHTRTHKITHGCKHGIDIRMCIFIHTHTYVNTCECKGSYFII
jgi:hypothetical protein